MILLIDKYTKSIFLSQVLAVLEEEEDINEVQLKRIDQKLYKLPVNLPTLKIECKFFFNSYICRGSFFVKHFVFFKPTNLQVSVLAILSSA